MVFTVLCCPTLEALDEPPRLLRWLVEEGALAEAGEAVAELAAGKLTLVVESPAAGALRRILAAPGAALRPDVPLAVFGPPAEPLSRELAELPVLVPPPPASPAACDDAEIDVIEGNPETLSPMRRVVARRMARSSREAPCFYLTTSVDMGACEGLRARLKAEKRKATYNDMVVKAAALALRERPGLLRAFAGGALWPRTSINIGVALAVEDGLVVPVVKDADARTLEGIATEVRELARRARDRKLAPADCAGGVFTVSNLGTFDIDHFIAIVNPGEAGILAAGKIEPRPVARDGQVVIRPMMNITLSGDHRVIDGAEGARFNAAVKRRLESPDGLL